MLRDLARAGEVIDAAAGAVGDDIRMGALTFGIEDPSALLADARREAVEKATRQASELAVAAGVTLGPIRSHRRRIRGRATGPSADAARHGRRGGRADSNPAPNVSR